MSEPRPSSQEDTPRRAGIRKVARLAGVSTATVSRVFSDAQSVSPETRERVMASAASLGYQPSPLGRNLVHGRSYLIGLIVPNLSFPLYGAMIHGIEDVLSRNGMSALLASGHDDSATEAEAAQHLLKHAVDGGIVINSRVGARLPARRQADWVHIAPETPGLPYRVELDNQEGGRLAAMELLGHGRRFFGFVGAPGRESLEREAGFAQQLRAAGLGYRRFTGDYSEGSGEAAAQELLQEPLDAVFAAGDLMAAGVLRALHTRGLGVPAEVAVVGFDDAAFASLLYPRLSSIRQPAYQMGVAAAELALSLTLGRPAAPVTFPPELIRRESTGPP